MSIFDSTNTPPRIVTFSSLNAVTGSSSSFQSTPIDLGVNDYDSVVLLDANIPKSFYNFPNGFNTFRLTELGSSIIITITPGSYNVLNLITTLSTLLTAGSTSLGHNWVYTVTYSPVTQGDTFFLTFSVSGNSGQPTITMLSGSVSPFRQLGFDDGNSYTFSSNTLSSVNAINLALVLTAYIQSNLVTSVYNGILQQFLNMGSTPPLSVLYYQQINYDINSKAFNRNNKNSWSFNLVDGLFLPIDTNGVPWSFTVCFFKRANTHEIHKNALNFEREMTIYNIEKQKREILNNVNELIENEADEPYADTIVKDFLPPDIHYPSK